VFVPDGRGHDWKVEGGTHKVLLVASGLRTSNGDRKKARARISIKQKRGKSGKDASGDPPYRDRGGSRGGRGQKAFFEKPGPGGTGGACKETPEERVQGKEKDTKTEKKEGTVATGTNQKGLNLSGS